MIEHNGHDIKGVAVNFDYTIDANYPLCSLPTRRLCKRARELRDRGDNLPPNSNLSAESYDLENPG